MSQKNRIAAVLTGAVMLLSSCSSAPKTQYKKTENERTVINVWSSEENIADIVHCFLVNYPEFAEQYEIVPTVITRYSDEYETALEESLRSGDANAPDIYVVPSDLAGEFCRGKNAYLAASYDQFFDDLENRLNEAEIAPYTVEVGTRSSDGKVVGLSYEGGQGMVLYRRSIAMDVWGTDDPEKVAEHIGGGTESWDQFIVASEEIRDAGYSIVPGYEDLWVAFSSSSEKPWFIGDELCIDPQREAYLDVARTLRNNQSTNNRAMWSPEWYKTLEDLDDRKVFGYFCPVWLLNDQIAFYASSYEGDEDQVPIAGTYGDWAMCTPPQSYWWGGSWVLAGRQVIGTDKEAGVKKILEYMTLDYRESGLQHVLANGYLRGYEHMKNSVPSCVVLRSADGSMPILNGQDPYLLIEAETKKCIGTNLCEYDGVAYSLWINQVKCYAEGNKTKEETLSDFRSDVSNQIKLDGDD